MPAGKVLRSLTAGLRDFHCDQGAKPILILSKAGKPSARHHQDTFADAFTSYNLSTFGRQEPIPARRAPKTERQKRPGAVPKGNNGRLAFSHKAVAAVQFQDILLSLTESSSGLRETTLSFMRLFLGSPGRSSLLVGALAAHLSVDDFCAKFAFMVASKTQATCANIESTLEAYRLCVEQ